MLKRGQTLADHRFGVSRAIEANRLLEILQLYISSYYDTSLSLYAQVEEVVTVKVL